MTTYSMGFPHFVGNLWKMKPLLSQIFFTFAYATGPPHFSVNVLLLVAKLQPIAQRQCCDFRLQNIQCLRFRASRQANLGDTIIMELWLWIKSCIFPFHNRSPIFAGSRNRSWIDTCVEMLPLTVLCIYSLHVLASTQLAWSASERIGTLVSWLPL